MTEKDLKKTNMYDIIIKKERININNEGSVFCGMFA